MQDKKCGKGASNPLRPAASAARRGAQNTTFPSTRWVTRVRELRPKSAVDPSGQRWVGFETPFLDDAGISILIGDVTLSVKPGFAHLVLTDVVCLLMTVC